MDKKEFIEYANKELFENGKMEIIDDVFTKNYVTHTANRNYEGHDFIKRWFKQIRQAMPDVRVENIELFIQESNRFVWQRTLKGKHTTRMWGVKPSAKNITWNEMVVSRFEKDKIAEEWVVSELKGEILSKPPLEK